MGMRSRISRIILAIAIVAALMSAATQSAFAAKQGKSGKAAKAKIVSAGATTLAHTGKLKVTVRGWNPKTKVRAKARARQGGKSISLGRKKFRTHRGRTSFAILLGPASRGTVSSCLPTTIKVTLVARGKSRGKVRTSAKVRRDTSFCAGSRPRGLDVSDAGTCDPIATNTIDCLSPFPNNYYTKKDPTSDTGLRVDLKNAAMPVSDNNDHAIDTTELNTAEGFSPGAMITAQIPGLDNQAAFDRTGIVRQGKMSMAYEKKQPVVVIDKSTLERQLIWAEMDSNVDSDKNRPLIIRPGKNLTDGHTYIVALRNLKTSAGKTIKPPVAFKLFRDRIPSGVSVLEKRRAHFNQIFRKLGKAGIKRNDLYLAWDFTVNSTTNLTERMLHIRDNAFSLLGDNNLADNDISGTTAPVFNVQTVTDYPTATGDGIELIRRVEGTFQVPCYLHHPDPAKQDCDPGARFELDANGMPIRNPGSVMTAKFICNIPRTAADGTNVIEKARPSLYGHGLFGTVNEVKGKNIRQLSAENNVITCATEWSGMADEDVVPSALPALVDLSKFPSIPDRLQQGFLNFMYLGRLLIHPDGFSSDPAFQFNGVSAIDTQQLFYYGNSQGGIAGGALTALSPDVRRSVLYVPGINYSTLLPRSVDFDDYQVPLYGAYIEERQKSLIFSIMQMMWDRGEPDGYANHMTTDPLPNTPSHKVLIEMSYGDHQVSNVTTEVEARTIGAPLREPSVDANRLAAGDDEPHFEMQTLGDLSGPAADGSGMFIWDIGPKRGVEPNVLGTIPEPLTNSPPRDAGVDPHDTVIRSSARIRKQIADFLKINGKITNPCGNDPCYAAGWNGFND